MFAFVDCDSFYASCEQVFRPDLRGKPVVVVSTNNRLVIARSKEAKALGVPAPAPLFQVEHFLRKENIAVFSSNYSLYGDMSRRVMHTLKRFGANLDVYAIDEMFLRIKNIRDLDVQGQIMRDAVWQDVRIPVSIGMAPTRTLAKLANHMAKKIPCLNGVCILDAAEKWQWVLRRLPAATVWGIDNHLSRRLESLRIYSAWDLANANASSIQSYYDKRLERTIDELNGHSCVDMEHAPMDKKQIYYTRSFESKTAVLQSVQEVVAGYATQIAEKLKQQNYLAVAMHMFIHSSLSGADFYSNSAIAKLPRATDDTRQIVGLALMLAERLYKPGPYLRVGIGLLELLDKRLQQTLESHRKRSDRPLHLIQVADELNQRESLSGAFLSVQELKKTEYNHHHHCSPQYTSRWGDIPTVKME